MEYSPPGSSVHGILQARILDWVAMASSRDLPDPGIKPASPALQANSLSLNHQKYRSHQIWSRYWYCRTSTFPATKLLIRYNASVRPSDISVAGWFISWTVSTMKEAATHLSCWHIFSEWVWLCSSWGLGSHHCLKVFKFCCISKESHKVSLQSKGFLSQKRSPSSDRWSWNPLVWPHAAPLRHQLGGDNHKE